MVDSRATATAATESVQAVWRNAVAATPAAAYNKRFHTRNVTRPRPSSRRSKNFLKNLSTTSTGSNLFTPR
jgi:hypothetical protein